MDLNRVCESMNEQEQFTLAMNVLRPGFVAIPSWIQKVAFERYKSYAEEIKENPDLGELKPAELNRALWLPDSVDRYIDAAAKAQAIASTITEQRDCLYDIEELAFLMRRELGLFMMLNDSGHALFSIDLEGKLPVVSADFGTEDGKISNMELFGNEVDLALGRVVSELTQELRERQLLEKQKAAENIEKPTGKQLAMARHLAGENGVELPWLASKKEASAFIERFTKEENQDRPTPKQLRAAKAIAAEQKVDVPYFATKTEASAFIKKYGKDLGRVGHGEKQLSLNDRIKMAQREAAEQPSKRDTVIAEGEAR